MLSLIQYYTRKLTDAQLRYCEGEFTVDECKRALDGMATGKSKVGRQGPPARILPMILDHFERRLHRNHKLLLFCGQALSNSKVGVITLLHKRGDRLEMKNWRPITLLCIDYKIAVKGIANHHLLDVLQFAIHEDQTCGEPGRNPNESSWDIVA